MECPDGMSGFEAASGQALMFKGCSNLVSGQVEEALWR